MLPGHPPQTHGAKGDKARHFTGFVFRNDRKRRPFVNGSDSVVGLLVISKVLSNIKYVNTVAQKLKFQSLDFRNQFSTI